MRVDEPSRDTPHWMTSLLVRLALVPLIFLLGPRLAHATIFVTPSAALVERADAIALGAVRAVTPRWEGGRIVTDVTLDVAQTIKGALPQTISIVAPGGKIGDIVMRVIGGASFRVGDRSIVFLTRRSGVHRLLGLGAGKLDVYSRDGRELVAWPHDNIVEEAPLARVLDGLSSLARGAAR